MDSALFPFKNLRRPVALYRKPNIFVPVALPGAPHSGNFHVPLEGNARKILAPPDLVAAVADEEEIPFYALNGENAGFKIHSSAAFRARTSTRGTYRRLPGKAAAKD